MYNSKLIQTLMLLDKDERRMLKKYININYVNKHKDLMNFYLFISGKRKITKENITKEKAFEYLYGNTPYKDLTIRHLLWLCTELMEDFVTKNNIQKDNNLKKEILANFYYRKTLYNYAENISREKLSSLQQQKQLNSTLSLHTFKVNALIYDIDTHNKRGADFNLNDILKNLYIFLIIEILRYGITAITIKNIAKTEAYNPLLQPVMDLLPESIFIQNMLIKIYYFTYKLLESNDEIYFKELIVDIKQNEHLLNFKDLNTIYRLLINFCIRKSNQNILEYRIILFDIYLSTIKKGYLLENNQITRFTFSNTVATGIRLNELTKVQQFIRIYRYKIEDGYQEITIAFNSAKLFYAKGEKQKALKILLTHQFRDVFWNLNMKHLLLKILYETGDYKLLRHYIKIFRNYLNLKDNLGYHKNYFLQICYNMSTLIKYTQNPKLIKNYTFKSDIPDAEWFNNELQAIRI